MLKIQKKKCKICISRWLVEAQNFTHFGLYLTCNSMSMSHNDTKQLGDDQVSATDFFRTHTYIVDIGVSKLETSLEASGKMHSLTCKTGMKAASKTCIRY